ncbi:MAG: 4-hydroxy-tetrahydrodipicolinate synthase [Chlamydiae bacterium]|nr:4-hydroxy-tetrahydrodipicolinate synthase [Chlamydiota bacterium]
MLQGSIAAIITPFLENGEVDFIGFRNLVLWHIEEKTDALVICGTTGEGSTLSPEEQIELLRSAVREAKGRVPVIMGTGTNDTRVSARNTEAAKENGADGCLVIVPYYNKPTFEGCYEHFSRIANVGLPVIVYHHPGRTGIKFSAEQLSDLCLIPQVIGIKDASGDIQLAAEFMRISSASFFSGDDALTLPLIALGAKGVISVVANVIPGPWKELVASCIEGDYTRARVLLAKYLPLCNALFLETNPQGVKYAVSLLKRCEPYLRLPLIEPKEVVKEQIARALHGAIWETQIQEKEIPLSVL